MESTRFHYLKVDEEINGLKFDSDILPIFDSDEIILYKKSGLKIYQFEVTYYYYVVKEFIDREEPTVGIENLAYTLYLTNKRIVILANEVFGGDDVIPCDSLVSNGAIYAAVISYKKVGFVDVDKYHNGKAFYICSGEFDSDIITRFFAEKEELMTILKIICDTTVSCTYDDEVDKSGLTGFYEHLDEAYEHGFEYSQVLSFENKPNYCNDISRLSRFSNTEINGSF